MTIVFSPEAKDQLSKLPPPLKKKAQKQFGYLLENYKHPSLRARKMGGKGVFESRIDKHYRFTFVVSGEEIYVLTVGPHDEGLGKK
jgi:mRNA interferase RelE/StbE